MKITKYPQSCFVIETAENKILIDPGKLSYEDKFLDEWKKVDAIFITHAHGDHCYAEFLKDVNCPVYSIKEVQKTYPNLKINICKAGDFFELGEIKVNVLESIHGYLPRLTHNNVEINEAVGFIFEIEGKKVYHLGDTVCFKTDKRHYCDILLAPVSAHELVMSPYGVAKFSKEVKANLVIPMHMDNPDFPVDIDIMKKTFEKYNVSYKYLTILETIEF